MRKFGFLEKYFLYLFNFLSSDYEVEFSVPEYCDRVVIFFQMEGDVNFFLQMEDDLNFSFSNGRRHKFVSNGRQPPLFFHMEDDLNSFSN